MQDAKPFADSQEECGHLTVLGWKFSRLKIFLDNIRTPPAIAISIETRKNIAQRQGEKPRLFCKPKPSALRFPYQDLNCNDRPEVLVRRTLDLCTSSPPEEGRNPPLA